MTQAILTLNLGSSSIKFQIFSVEKDLPLILRGKVGNLETDPILTVSKGSKQFSENLSVHKTEDLLKHIFSWIDLNEKSLNITAIGHRVAHGGNYFKNPVIATNEVIDKLQNLSPLVPLHQTISLQAIRAARHWRPKAKQIACFDTAFHTDHDDLFNSYALPQALRDQGIKRYGFHGLSYEWIVYSLKKSHPQMADSRFVIAHLGSGASLCAIKDFKSVDTTMGMTALDGLPMSTRCGSLDPGAVLYMIEHLGLSPEQVEFALYHLSGLKALSGSSGDIQRLLNDTNISSRFAIDYFCLKTAQYIAMMAVSIGGMDALVFTGGIGENNPEIRNAILKHLTFLMPFDTLVIPTDEERMIAMHALECLGDNP